MAAFSSCFFIVALLLLILFDMSCGSSSVESTGEVGQPKETEAPTQNESREMSQSEKESSERTIENPTFLSSTNVHDPQEDLKKILSSGALPELDKIWQRYQQSYETLITQSLKETFGKGSMNLFARVAEDSIMKIADGFHAFDNAVDVVFSEMRLLAIPTMEEVSRSLSLVFGSFFLSAVLSRIHVFTRYHLYKLNQTMEYLPQNQDPNKMSPFTFHQVQDYGDLTIVADRCQLSGHAVLSLVGSTVSLGHNNFRLKDCEFSVEISTPGLGSPPVFAPYFVRDQARELMRVMSKPLRDVAAVRLQNIFFSVINITSIFGEDADRLRNTMQAVSKKSADYFDDVLKALNRQSFEHSKSLVPVDDFHMDFKKEISGVTEHFVVSIADVTITGLETAYSSRSGGIFIASETANLAEAVSFSNLQVRGRYELVMRDKIMGRRIISVDIRDATAHVDLELFDGAKVINKTKLNNPVKKNQPRVDHINFSGWSQLDVALFDRQLEASVRQQLLSTISGYISNSLPSHIERYLRSGLQAAIGDVDNYLLRLRNMTDEGNPIAKSQDHNAMILSDTERERDSKSGNEPISRIKPYRSKTSSSSEDTQVNSSRSTENKSDSSVSGEDKSGSESSKNEESSSSSDQNKENSSSSKNTQASGSGADENTLDDSSSGGNESVDGSNKNVESSSSSNKIVQSDSSTEDAKTSSKSVENNLGGSRLEEDKSAPESSKNGKSSSTSVENKESGSSSENAQGSGSSSAEIKLDGARTGKNKRRNVRLGSTKKMESSSSSKSAENNGSGSGETQSGSSAEDSGGNDSVSNDRMFANKNSLRNSSEAKSGRRLRKHISNNKISVM